MFVIYLYLRSLALLGYILYVSAKQKGYAGFMSLSSNLA